VNNPKRVSIEKMLDRNSARRLVDRSGGSAPLGGIDRAQKRRVVERPSRDGLAHCRCNHGSCDADVGRARTLFRFGAGFCCTTDVERSEARRWTFESVLLTSDPSLVTFHPDIRMIWLRLA